MKHRVVGRVLGRERNQRKALIKTLLGSLIVRERITTTEAKAKEIKRYIDPIVIKAKQSRADETRKVALIRQLNQLVPAVAARKITGEFADRFQSRTSGFVRVVRLEPRKSDGARMAVVEFV